MATQTRLVKLERHKWQPADYANGFSIGAGINNCVVKMQTRDTLPDLGAERWSEWADVPIVDVEKTDMQELVSEYPDGARMREPDDGTGLDEGVTGYSEHIAGPDTKLDGSAAAITAASTDEKAEALAGLGGVTDEDVLARQTITPHKNFEVVEVDATINFGIMSITEYNEGFVKVWIAEKKGGVMIERSEIDKLLAELYTKETNA